MTPKIYVKESLLLLKICTWWEITKFGKDTALKGKMGCRVVRKSGVFFLCGFTLTAKYTYKSSFCFCFLYLLVFGRTGTSLPCAGFLSLRGAGSPRHLSAGASHCGAQSSRVRGLQQFLRVRQSLRLAGSRAQAQGLSCPTAWDPPWPGTEPVSYAVQDGLPITGPPGNPIKAQF